jgi:hypothetical protein
MDYTDFHALTQAIARLLYSPFQKLILNAKDVLTLSQQTKLGSINFSWKQIPAPRQQLERDSDVIIGLICQFRATAPLHPDHTTL